MKSIILIIAFLASIFSYANNNEEKEPKIFSISGKVVDNNESLTGVKVILDGKESVVYTDFDGNFTINNVVEGEHTVSFSFVTYDNKVITFNPNNNSNLVIELKAK